MICANCALPGSLECTKCHVARYCGKSCQKKHWKKSHKNECCCAICYVALCNPVKLPCGHTFHKECSKGLEQFKVACPLCEVNDFTKAYVSMKSETPDFKKMEELAESGDVRAQYYMAVLFRSVKSHDQGLKWCLIAAENGHKDAQHEMAFMYHHGELVEKDDTKALFWTIKAADQGIHEAQKNAANHFFFGEGCEVDKVMAAKYYDLASKHDPESAYNLGIMYLQGIGVSKNETKAMEMFFRAGDHELSQFTLGVMLAKGQGRPVNLPLSARLFQKASDKGNVQATFNLGLAYLEGHGVPKDLHMAACLNMRAASKGLPDAQFQLGLCSLAGQGVEKSLDKATEWFRLAAEQGYGDAQFCLGRILFDQKSPEAMLWIIKAAENGNEYAAMVLDEVASQFENVETFQSALSASIHGIDEADLNAAIKDLKLEANDGKVA